jgi:hypothetical protein
VGQDQRQRLIVRRAGVEEVDVQPIDLGPELRDRVQPGLGGAPVVARAPVVAELLDVGERDALGPVVDGLLLRPASAVEPIVQIGKLRLADLDAERLNLG